MVSMKQNALTITPFLINSPTCNRSPIPAAPPPPCDLFLSLLWLSIPILTTPLCGLRPYPTPAHASIWMSSSPCPSSDTPGQATPLQRHPPPPAQALTLMTGHTPVSHGHCLPSTWTRALHSRTFHAGCPSHPVHTLLPLQVILTLLCCPYGFENKYFRRERKWTGRKGKGRGKGRVTDKGKIRK